MTFLLVFFSAIKCIMCFCLVLSCILLDKVCLYVFVGFSSVLFYDFVADLEQELGCLTKVFVFLANKRKEVNPWFYSRKKKKLIRIMCFSLFMLQR